MLVRCAIIGSWSALLCLALTTGGANSSFLAAAFGALSAGLLLVYALLTPQKMLTRFVWRNWISLLGFVVFVGWAFATTLRPAGPWAHPLWASLGVSGGAIALSPFRVYEGLAGFIGPACAFMLGALVDQSQRERSFALLTVAVAGAAFAVIGFGQYLLQPESTLIRARLTTAIGANGAATAFGVFALLCLSIAIIARRTPPKARLTRSPLGDLIADATGAPFALATLLLCVIALAATGSRGGALAFAAAFFLLVGAHLSAGARTHFGARAGGFGFALLFSLAVVVAGVIFAVPLLAERFRDAPTDAVLRWQGAMAHWQAFLDRPIFGHGLNSFAEINAYYATIENWKLVANIGAAHNIYIQLLEEAGLIGASAMALMVIPPIWRALAGLQAIGSRRALNAAALCASAMVGAHGMVDFGMNIPAIAALYAFVLGACGIGVDDKRS